MRDELYQEYPEQISFSGLLFDVFQNNMKFLFSDNQHIVANI